jgi:uncharacterized membrane protein
MLFMRTLLITLLMAITMGSTMGLPNSPDEVVLTVVLSFAIAILFELVANMPRRRRRYRR